MNALWFLWIRSRINKCKRALKKPATYIYLLFIVFYVWALLFNTKIFFENPSEKTIAMLLTGFSLLMIPGNLTSYAKRKGLLYKNSDVHFMFPSPIAPKTVLVYAYVQTILTKLVLCVGIVLIGIISFHATPWKMVVYGFFSIILQNSYEGALAVILYGSEKLTDTHRTIIKVVTYAVLASLGLVAILVYLKIGFGSAFIDEYLNGSYLQFVPVVGWYAAIVHLIIIGPTTVNLLGTALYLVTWAVLMVLAVRMKCTGEFYEDALKFAEDYEEAVSKQKKGQQFAVIGKKQKFKAAKVEWKGTGARALFYRQLLEYKKAKFFIFNLSMVAYLAFGIGIAVLGYLDPEEFGNALVFIILGVGAYITFLFAAVNGKWAKELASPYTYLMPDNTFKKLMNVTLIANLQNLICAVLLTLPATIVLGISPVSALLAIVGLTVFSASRIYAHAVADVVIGDTLGVFGKQMLEMLALGVSIGLGAMGALLGFFWMGEVTALLLMNLLMLLYCVILVTIATLNFYFWEK